MAYLHGIEREDLLSRELSGLRLGLITNPSGVDKKLNSTIDILREKFDLRALFSPEHGVRGGREGRALHRRPLGSAGIHDVRRSLGGVRCLLGA